MQRTTLAFARLVSRFFKAFPIFLAIFVATSNGSSVAPIPPGVIEILEAPAGGLRLVGSPSTLTVNARGAGILFYQWYRGTATSPFTAIPGAIQPTYTLHFPTAGDTAYYSVRVSNFLGSITTEPVLLSYEAPIGSLARQAPTFYELGTGRPDGGVQSILSSADGGYVVGGAFTDVSLNGLPWSSVSRRGLARINADGSLDTGYPSFPDDVTVHDMVKDSQGRIVLVFNTGAITAKGVKYTRNGVARILADGSLDRNFIGPFTSPSTLVRCLAIDAADRIYIGDETQVVRLTGSTGAKDPTFTTWDGGASAILPMPNGTLVLAGVGGGTARVDADTPNPNNPGGFAYVNAMPSGKVFPLPGTTDFLETGYLGRGIRRKTINNHGAVWLGTGPKMDDLGYGAGIISAVLSLPSGNLVMGGIFGTYNDTRAGSIVHVAPDGTIAPGVNFGNGFYGHIRALALASNGQLLVGGSLTSYNSSPISDFAIVRTTAEPAPPDPGAPVPDTFTQYLIDAGVPSSRQGTADDYDGDGAPNEWEYYIGTDPADPASVILRLWASTRNNNIVGEAVVSPDTIDYEPGTRVNVSAPPAPGLTLIGWAPTDYDPVTGYAAAVSDNPLEFTLTQNRSLVAYQGLPLASTLQSTPTQTWTTGGNALWTGTTDVMAPTGGLGSARATALSSAGEEAWLETTVNAPGILGFNWRLDIASPATPFGGVANFEVEVNGVTVGGLYMAAPFSAAAFHIPGPGPVNVRFRLRRTQDYPRTPVGGQESAYLANFYFGPLTPPTFLATTDVTKTSLTLNWAAPVGGDGYQLEFSADDSFNSGVQTFSLDRQTTRKTIEGLEAGTTYYYRVTAHGIDGSTTVSSVGASTTVAKKTQAITFDPLADQRPNSPPFGISATTTAPGLTVAFTISGPAFLSGRTVILSGAEGVVTITATQAGDANYAAAPPSSRSFTVAGVAQTITFNGLADRPSTAAPFDLAATASSGLPVAFSITGPAALGANGKTLTPTGEPGTVSVTATQAGGLRNGNVYTAAEPVTNRFEIIPVSPTWAQTIDFRPPPSKIYGDPAFTLTASASSALPVGFTLVSGPAILTNGELAITGAGKIVVAAAQTGNGRFKPASITRTITVNKAPLAVSFDSVSRLVRVANPAFLPLYSGFVNGDTAADLAATRPVGVTTALLGSPQGSYPITFKGGLDANYRYVRGAPAALTVLGFGGRYEALLSHEGVYVGKVGLTVRRDSLSYTGTLTLASEPEPLPLRGELTPSEHLNSATGTCTRAGAGQATLHLFFETGGGAIDGGLNRDSAPFAQMEDGFLISEVSEAAPALGVGAYTMVFLPATHSTAGDHTAIPRGAGYATGTINANGKFVLKGKLADGTPLTTSLERSASGLPLGAIYRLFAKPYGRRLDSFFGGPIYLYPHEDDTRFPGRLRFRDEALMYYMVWQKTMSPAKPLDPSYRDGFGPLVVEFTVDPWLSPSARPVPVNGVTLPAGTLVQRLDLAPSSTSSATVSVTYSLAEGLDLGARSPFLPTTLNLSPAGRLTVPLPIPAAADNPVFSLTISPSTGAFTGSFLLRDQVGAPPAKAIDRKATFSGTLRQGPAGSDTIGRAHILLDPNPADSGPAANEQVSGELILTSGAPE